METQLIWWTRSKKPLQSVMYIPNNPMIPFCFWFMLTWCSLSRGPSESFSRLLQMFNSWPLDSSSGRHYLLFTGKRNLSTSADHMAAGRPDSRLRRRLFASYFHDNRLNFSLSIVTEDQIRCSRALRANSSFAHSDTSCFCPFLSSL